MKFQNNFAAIEKLIIQAAKEAIEETAQEVAAEAAENAPKKTGELSESYTYEMNGELSAIIGSTSDHALPVEIGGSKRAAQPHFTPALAAAEDKIKRKFRNKING